MEGIPKYVFQSSSTCSSVFGFVHEWGNPQIMWLLISFSMVESQFWASSCFQMDSFEGKSRGNSVFPLKYQGFLQLFPQTNAKFLDKPACTSAFQVCQVAVPITVASGFKMARAALGGSYHRRSPICGLCLSSAQDVNRFNVHIYIYVYYYIISLCVLFTIIIIVSIICYYNKLLLLYISDQPEVLK